MGKKDKIISINTSPQNWGWLIHIIPWGILLGFPFLMAGRDASEAVPLHRYLSFLTMFASFIVMFYVNYLFLINRFLFNKQTVKYLLSNLLLIVVLIAIVHFIQEQIPLPIDRPPHKFDPHWTQVLGFFLALSSVYVLVGALSVAFKMTSSWYMAEAERKDLEQSRSEAELQNLKSQLNPHFLFNTLNNIYSLIAFSPEKAQKVVHDLSRLLRYVMYESSQPFVLLEKDLDFVRNYVELMHIRLPEYVELKTEIDTAVPGTMIAPLLFISLIENAFKHGVSNNKPSFIHIKIYQEKNQVTCLILNSDYHKDVEQDKSGSGIGLINLQKRLSLLYPEQYLYEYGHKDGNYRSYLSITINEPDL